MMRPEELRAAGSLAWALKLGYEEATIGFSPRDSVSFTLSEQPTCYRRGRWVLHVEIARGPAHALWGCFDEQDQPMRYYHDPERAKAEASAIALVLATDRLRAGTKS